MSTVTQYAYLNARVSAMATHLLSESRLNELIQLPPTHQQAMGIKELDNWLSDPSINPSLVERAWFIHWIHEVKVLLRPLPESAKELLIYWLHKCEISNLKAIIRGKRAGTDLNVVQSQLIDLGSLALLPVDSLLRTENIGELLLRLENSAYYYIARQSRRVFEQDHKPYSLDAAIDRHYLLGLHKRLTKLSLSERDSLTPLISVLFDNFNLIWLLRYRLTYGLSPAETYFLLMPTPYRLDAKLLRKLVELQSLNDILAQLPRDFHQLLGEVDSIFAVECRLNARLGQIAEFSLKYKSFSLAKVFAYVVLRELEMRRTIAILKGKFLGMKVEQIKTAAGFLPLL